MDGKLCPGIQHSPLKSPPFNPEIFQPPPPPFEILESQTPPLEKGGVPTMINSTLVFIFYLTQILPL